jgi:hypothetical protein
MMDSILNTIKKLLGILIDDTAFDQDLLVHINSTFMTLNQLGIGPATVYSIESSTPTWFDFLGTDVAMYSLVKTYMFLKVRMAFDPPGTSFVLESLKSQITEYEWRLSVQVPIPPDPIV